MYFLAHFFNTNRKADTMAKRKIKCPFCDTYFIDMDGFVSHLDKKHHDSIPQDQTAWQYAYFLHTGKDHGNCVMCKSVTGWNESTHKYNRFCDNPKCKEKYIQMFQDRMIGKYGKTTLLNDPEQQKKMLANRKISGEYEWSDHVHKFPYTGSYELEFLKFLDLDMMYDPEDIMAPSPHTYNYQFEGKTHFYIPDFFISSLNLEVEIKDGGDNPNNHWKIQEVDKKKERAKDLVMQSNKKLFNYIKVTNKDHDKFLRYLMVAKQRFLEEDNSPIFMP